MEFECDEVAKIVADTMNNYLMFDKLLKCECSQALYLVCFSPEHGDVWLPQPLE